MNGVGVDLNLLSEKEKSRQETAGDSIPQRVTWSLVNRVYGRCDIVISPSEAIKRELSKRGLAKRIEVVSNGVDLDRFARKSDFAPTGRIIHTGRLGFEKNLRVVLTAFAEIAGKNPGYELIIAGDGPARKELEKMSKDLGVDNRVKFLGMIKRDDLPQIYRSGDVFATASTMETQGMVVLEAMACGLPVVGVRKYALPDLIKDGVNGFVVKPGGEKQMAGKLEYILNNPRLIRKMGMKAVETARKHDIRLMAEKLSGVYAEAMLIKFNGGTKKI